jgi:hypothetical protein
MAIPTANTIQVATTIDPELREQLTAKRTAADRSEAAEIRQAIKAWVELDNQKVAA